MPSVVPNTRLARKTSIWHLKTWVMYFRRGKVTRGPMGAPPKSGLWLGPACVIMTKAVQQWSESVHSTTGQIGVVWVSHGNKLIRCHSHSTPSMQRKRSIDCLSERSCAISMPDERDRTDERLVSRTTRRPVDKFANSR